MIFKKEKKNCNEYQIGGDHYIVSELQPIEVILKWNINFCLGNVIKYIFRYQHGTNHNKRIEDLLKAKHYIEIEIENIKKTT